MLNNGGRFINYFSRHTVTHIVCSHLTDSKMKNMRYINQCKWSEGMLIVCLTMFWFACI
jgi:hypothetical protein